MRRGRPRKEPPSRTGDRSPRGRTAGSYATRVWIGAGYLEAVAQSENGWSPYRKVAHPPEAERSSNRPPANV